MENSWCVVDDSRQEIYSDLSQEEADSLFRELLDGGARPTELTAGRVEWVQTHMDYVAGYDWIMPEVPA